MKTAIRKIAANIAGLVGVTQADLAAAAPDRSSKWHQGLIAHLASLAAPATYVEIGVHHCGLFNQMLPFAQKLVAVDANPASRAHMAQTPKTQFFHGTSMDFAAHLKREPLLIDFLFIDADHSKEAVDADFNGLFEFVADHGLILLHDTHPADLAATDAKRCGDGYLAIERLSCQTDRWEMMTLPRHPGLTLCRKRRRQLSWQEQEPRA